MSHLSSNLLEGPEQVKHEEWQGYLKVKWGNL